ncbi:hypothetical protein [Methyloferula stellata]|uniref:hypothetical protein n=1 Tax=Methyloferula stellata TaxID=876270 RepID=UPI0012697F4C|nr:hypothetical protein [Methyloferula stellata]
MIFIPVLSPSKFPKSMPRADLRKTPSFGSDHALKQKLKPHRRFKRGDGAAEVRRTAGAAWKNRQIRTMSGCLTNTPHLSSLCTAPKLRCDAKKCQKIFAAHQFIGKLVFG